MPDPQNEAPNDLTPEQANLVVKAIEEVEREEAAAQALSEEADSG